jgi:hypothetical protein
VLLHVNLLLKDRKNLIYILLDVNSTLVNNFFYWFKFSFILKRYMGNARWILIYLFSFSFLHMNNWCWENITFEIGFFRIVVQCQYSSWANKAILFSSKIGLKRQYYSVYCLQTNFLEIQKKSLGTKNSGITFRANFPSQFKLNILVFVKDYRVVAQ